MKIYLKQVKIQNSFIMSIFLNWLQKNFIHVTIVLESLMCFQLIKKSMKIIYLNIPLREKK
jgi:hypothetical protein